MHIENLWKPSAQDILLFKECYASEKVHGTSAHISWNNNQVTFFSGGANHKSFVSLFNKEKLEAVFKEKGLEKVILYGEAYGGKIQKMSDTYGPTLQFVVFDVKIDEYWLSMPQAEDFTKNFGLEFIPYVKIPTTMEAINAERDKPSEIAVRRGITEPKIREGIVLRPLFECKKNNGERIIAKHKRFEFAETRTPRPIDPSQLKMLKDAQAIAEEYVVRQRLLHVIDHLKGAYGGRDVVIKDMPDVIRAMIEDVIREGKGEILDNKNTRKAIGNRTAHMFKVYLQEKYL